MATIFQDVGGLKPQRTKFNLGYPNRYNCNMGELIPSYLERAEAGDIFEIGQEVLCRLQPLVSPVLDNLYISTEYFFVPFRLLYDHWEEYITGIKKDTIPPEEFTDPQPEWSPATSKDNTLNNKKFSLWDYCGFPVGVDPVGAYPLDYPRRAYNLIYNEWYRDENLQELVPLNNDKILYRSWRKDYFTSALPFRQKGVAPSIPIAGLGNVTFDFPDLSAKGVISADVSGLSGTIKSTNVTINGQGLKPVKLDSSNWINYLDITNEGSGTGIGIVSLNSVTGANAAASFSEWLSSACVMGG